MGLASHPHGSSHGREVALLPAFPSQAYFKFLQRKSKGLKFALEAKCSSGKNEDFFFVVCREVFAVGEDLFSSRPLGAA